MNREQWLENASVKLVDLFKQANLKMPEKFKLSCGFPKGNVKKTVGQCWSHTASSTGISEIFISPVLDKPMGCEGVLATLLHELIHVAVGIKEGHNKNFGYYARTLGLECKLTATIAGKELCSKLEVLGQELGEYPHGKLNLSESPVKKQTTRLVKLFCPQCHYIARVSRLHIDEKGTPICPLCKLSFVEGDDENE